MNPVKEVISILKYSISFALLYSAVVIIFEVDFNLALFTGAFNIGLVPMLLKMSKEQSKILNNPLESISFTSNTLIVDGHTFDKAKVSKIAIHDAGEVASIFFPYNQIGPARIHGIAFPSNMLSKVKRHLEQGLGDEVSFIT